MKLDGIIYAAIALVLASIGCAFGKPIFVLLGIGVMSGYELGLLFAKRWDLLREQFSNLRAIALTLLFIPIWLLTLVLEAMVKAEGAGGWLTTHFLGAAKSMLWVNIAINAVGVLYLFATKTKVLGR